jgi:hypothetical protein
MTVAALVRSRSDSNLSVKQPGQDTADPVCRRAQHMPLEMSVLNRRRLNPDAENCPASACG